MSFVRFLFRLVARSQVTYTDPYAHISDVANRLLELEGDVLASFHSLNGPFTWTDQRAHIPRRFVYRTDVWGCKFVQISITFGVGFSNNYHGPYRPIAELSAAKAQKVALVLAQGTAHL